MARCDDDWDWPPTIYGTGHSSPNMQSRVRGEQHPLGLLAAHRRNVMPKKNKRAAGKAKAKLKTEQRQKAADKKKPVKKR